jgi:hypothetical protein
MGYGAYMKVVNNRPTPIQTFVTGVVCMYDNGDQGSNLSLWNNAVIAGSTALPTSDPGQYIEEIGSGGCAFDVSKFSIKIEDANNHAIIGQIDFTEDDNDYEVANNDNKDVLDVYLNNSSPQARIQITVEAT